MTKLLGALLFASALCGACSSSNPFVETKTAPEGDHAALPDGVPASESGPSVWLANSTGFELTETGLGPGPGPGQGSSCPDSVETWKYDAVSRKLTRTGCDGNFRMVDDAVVLVPASAADLAAQISGLTSEAVAPPLSCGEDGADQTLTVTSPGGPSRYSSDFDADCPNAPTVAGPFVQWEALQTFTGQVEDYFSACESADGGPPDSSRATCVTSIAYPVVDGAAPDASRATDAPDASDGD